MPVSESRPHPGGAQSQAAANLDVQILAPHWREWSQSAERETPAGWKRMVEALAQLQDTVAGTIPSAEAVAEAAELMTRAQQILAGSEVAAERQLFGRHLAEPTRGQTFSPPLWVEDYTDGELIGRTRFGRFHSGNGGVTHGGAIALMFDDAMGRTSDLAVPERSRTVSLTVDFRSLTPLETDLEVRARLVAHEGRKRTIRGWLRDGDRLCAEATALFIELRPDQR
ncbi:PaaI family thioesterase [Microbacterium sp.]|uniref:PaaI family thioesterase n=1 Tax=Microbacterium sp. TaxID=51671 RepID=UPI0037C57D8B